jgi:hypothetical protein
LSTELNIWGNDTDGEDVRKAAFRDDASGLSITDAHVVNHSIKAAYPIQLLGHPLQILQP